MPDKSFTRGAMRAPQVKLTLFSLFLFICVAVSCITIFYYFFLSSSSSVASVSKLRVNVERSPATNLHGLSHVLRNVAARQGSANSNGIDGAAASDTVALDIRASDGRALDGRALDRVSSDSQEIKGGKGTRAREKRKLSLEDIRRYNYAITWKGAPLRKGLPHWQHLDNTFEAFVYSAHFDDVDFPPVVRIVGLARGGNLSYHDVTCSFYDSRDNTSVHHVPGRLYHCERRNKRKYIAAYVDCPLSQDMTSLPFAVSVYRDSDVVNNNYMIIHYSHSDHWVELHNNSVSLRNMQNSRQENSNSSTFDIIESKRQEDVWKWNITRCFPALHHGYNDHLQLADTVAASRVLGVQRFVFYVETAGPDVLRMLKMLEEEGLAEVYPWNMHLFGGELYYLAQFSNIQDCLYRHLWSSRYLLFGDTDELFAPRKHLSLLPLLQSQFGQNPDCGNFLFLHTIYNCKAPTQNPPRTVDPTGYAAQHRLPSLTHVVREATLWRPNDRSKPAVDPHKVKTASIHVVETLRKGFRQCTIPREDAYLHHYRCFKPAQPPEGQIHDAYLWKLGPAIIQQVQEYMLKYNSTVIEVRYMYP